MKNFAGSFGFSKNQRKWERLSVRGKNGKESKVIEMMYKMFPPGSAHGQSPERDALHKAAETHPDEQDFANAKEFTKSVLAKLQA